MTIVFIVAAFVFGYLVARGQRLARPQSALTVRVRQSRENGQSLQHYMSAQLVTRTGQTMHYERVDMRDPDWEEKLGAAVTRMKQKKHTLNALTRIAES